MEYFILTIIGGGILFGILYFLPLKQSLLEKTIYVISAIIFTNLFIFSRFLFDLWQAVLITLLLLLLVTYIVAKKLVFAFVPSGQKAATNEDVIILHNQVETNDASQVERTSVIEELALSTEEDFFRNTEIEQEKGEEVLSFETESYSLEEREIHIDEEYSLLPDKEPSSDEETGLLVEEELGNEEEYSLLEDTQVRSDQKDTTVEDNVLSSNEENSFLEDFMLEDRLTATEEETESHIAPDLDVLDKRMDLFAQLEDGEQIVETDLPMDQDATLIEIATNELEDVEPLQIPQEIQAELGDQEVAVTIETSEFAEVLEEFRGASSPETESMNTAVEEILLEDFVIADQELEDELVERNQVSEVFEEILLTESDFNLETENQVTDEEMVVQVTQQRKGQAVNRLLLEAMLDQLAWSKTKLSSQDYEILVLDHLHEGLNDLDYYTFASLLRDYYIESREYQKLLALLFNLNKRFEDKPVIQAEISFFLEKFYDKP